jgi:hypothetical protein
MLFEGKGSTTEIPYLKLYHEYKAGFIILQYKMYAMYEM